MKQPSKEGILRILLVRHGETEWNRIRRFQGRSDLELNDRGKAQVDSLALTLKEKEIKSIYSSPLLRAVETAKAVNRFHGATIEQRDGLMEMDLGDFEGYHAGDLAKEHPEFLKTWMKDPSSLRMPKGESLQEVQSRVWIVMEEIVETYTEGTVLICGHNFVNLTILCKVLGLELSHFRRIRQNAGAMSIVERSRGHYSLVCLNDICHLKDID